MFEGQEFHPIIESIFGEVNGLNEGPQIQVNCPKCQERDGLNSPDGKFNLEINTSKRVFRCWKCDFPQFSGSLGRLIRMFGGDIDYELYKSYAGVFYNFKSQEDDKSFDPIFLPKEMVFFSQMDDKNKNHLDAYKYLILDRKLDEKTIFKFRLGFCMEGNFRKRIIIPSFDEFGEVNYFVARNYETDNPYAIPYKNPKFNKNIIFNEGLINYDSVVFLVEGVFDLFALNNSIPLLGKTMSEKLVFKLKKNKPYVVVGLDPDARKDIYEIYNILYNIYEDESYKVRVLDIKGKHDIDEIRRKKGENGIRGLLKNVRTLNNDDFFYKSTWNRI